jgi:hypothetical protein
MAFSKSLSNFFMSKWRSSRPPFVVVRFRHRPSLGRCVSWSLFRAPPRASRFFLDISLRHRDHVAHQIDESIVRCLTGYLGKLHRRNPPKLSYSMASMACLLLLANAILPLCARQASGVIVVIPHDEKTTVSADRWRKPDQAELCDVKITPIGMVAIRDLSAQRQSPSASYDLANPERREITEIIRMSTGDVRADSPNSSGGLVDISGGQRFEPFRGFMDHSYPHVQSWGFPEIFQVDKDADKNAPVVLVIDFQRTLSGWTYPWALIQSRYLFRLLDLIAERTPLAARYQPQQSGENRNGDSRETIEYGEEPAPEAGPAPFVMVIVGLILFGCGGYWDEEFWDGRGQHMAGVIIGLSFWGLGLLCFGAVGLGWIG